jgi:hypothetical protein
MKFLLLSLLLLNFTEADSLGKRFKEEKYRRLTQSSKALPLEHPQKPKM